MEPPSPYSITILNESGKKVRQQPLRHAIQSTLGRHQMRPGTVGVWLCTNDSIQSLNRDYRQIDEPTDVLTFSATSAPSGSPLEFPIGDVAISVEYAQAQADARRASLEDEIAYLAVHGALHLCGFDDVRPNDRRQMQIAMAEMGEFLGLQPDPEWTSVLHAVVAHEVPS